MKCHCLGTCLQVLRMKKINQQLNSFNSKKLLMLIYMGNTGMCAYQVSAKNIKQG